MEKKTSVEKSLKEIIEILNKNTFYTGSGAFLALAALIISFIALIKSL